jgi:hypothetical protein
MTTTDCKRCCDTLTDEDVKKSETLCKGCFEYLTACQRRRDTALRHGLKFYPHPDGERYIYPVSGDPTEGFAAPGLRTHCQTPPAEKGPDDRSYKKGDRRGIQFVEELWQALEKAEWP